MNIWIVRFFFVKSEYNICSCPFFLFSFFLCIVHGWFFVPNSYEPTKHPNCFQKRKSPGKRSPINSLEKKKKRTSPIKQKILHLRLPIKKKKTTKRFHKWKESYKIDQKWLTKVGYILYCKRCSKFPELYYRKHELRRK